MKKILILLLIAALAFSTACTAPQKKPQATPEPVVTEEPVRSPERTEDAQESMKPDAGDEESPDATVIPELVPSAGTEDKTETEQEQKKQSN